MAEFEHRQAQEIRDACERHGVRYLFIGKSGAFLLGFPDTTQDVDLFVERTPQNCEALLKVLEELGFALPGTLAAEIRRGKALVQLRNSPFDLNLVFAPDGIDHFEDAWKRHVEVEGFPVCHIDDIIASKEATHRRRDLESLPRLRAFREYWLRQQRSTT
jgi:predicted nucleotidyltransferase